MIGRHHRKLLPADANRNRLTKPYQQSFQHYRYRSSWQFCVLAWRSMQKLKRIFRGKWLGLQCTEHNQIRDPRSRNPKIRLLVSFTLICGTLVQAVHSHLIRGNSVTWQYFRSLLNAFMYQARQERRLKSKWWRQWCYPAAHVESRANCCWRAIMLEYHVKLSAKYLWRTIRSCIHTICSAGILDWLNFWLLVKLYYTFTLGPPHTWQIPSIPRRRLDGRVLHRPLFTMPYQERLE